MPKHFAMTVCGLLAIYQKGNEWYCPAKTDKLGEVWDCLSQYKMFLNERFDDMEKALQGLHTKNKEDGQ